jgi:hypothetical protein
MPERSGAGAAAIIDAGRVAELIARERAAYAQHLYTVNRGVLLTPFHNMALCRLLPPRPTSTPTPRSSQPPPTPSWRESPVIRPRPG